MVNAVVGRGDMGSVDASKLADRTLMRLLPQCKEYFDSLIPLAFLTTGTAYSPRDFDVVQPHSGA